MADIRQMIITGGLSSLEANWPDFENSTDIWHQGIGVFGLTAMQWKDSYDANAEPSLTPETVKSWYAADGPHPGKWDDSAVEGFFSQPVFLNSSGSSGGHESTELPSSTVTSSSCAGISAGGVVGGVIGLESTSKPIQEPTPEPPQSALSRPNDASEELADTQNPNPSSAVQHWRVEPRAELDTQSPPPAFLHNCRPFHEFEDPGLPPAEFLGHSAR